jgi:hypothetical protein
MNATPDKEPNFKIVRLAGSLYIGSGFLFTFGSCCWWSFSGLVQSPVAPNFSGGAIELIKKANAAQLWSMAAVCLLLVGGMANVAFGIGFQRPNRSVARRAKWTSGLIAGFCWCYLATAAFFLGSVTIALWAGMLSLVWTILFLVAGAAVAEIDELGATIQPDRAWTDGDEDELRNALSPRSRDKTNR